MYKGRAATELPEDTDKKPWDELTKCPYEDLANPERVHVDPLGYVHVCQGISIGNAWQKPFSARGMNLEQILAREALTQRKAVYYNPNDLENHHLTVLSQHLKQLIHQEAAVQDLLDYLEFTIL